MNALIPTQIQVPAFTMSDMERVANAIAKGGLFGSKDPNAVLTLCMVAQAEGKHPGLVMQQYHIISGKPAKKADAMLQDFLAQGGKVEWHQLDDSCADATFSHPAGGSVRITWDDKRVQQAGLGGNPMHKKYPRAMKRSRTVSEGVRTVFPGATSGMYVPEEVQDMVDEAPRSAPPAPKAQRARDVQAEQPALEAPKRTLKTVVADLMAAVEQADTPEALDAILDSGDVHTLQDKHYDRYEAVAAAVSERRAQLAEGDMGEEME